MNRFRVEVESVYAAWQPMCELNYTKDVHTAREMVATERGNCFTLAEMACQQLIQSEQVAAAGIVLTAAPRRRNTHAYCVAFSTDISAVARIDLINGKVQFPHLPRATKTGVRQVMAETESEAVLYSSNNGRGTAADLTLKLLVEPYEWLEGSVNHKVYLPAKVGITALQTIAELGGMRQILNRADLPPGKQQIIPEIPYA